MGKSARFQIYKKDGDYCEAEMWNCSRVLECMFQGSVFCLFSLYFFNCFSSTVVSIFPPLLSPTLPTPTHTLDPTPCCLCPWVLYTCSLMTLPFVYPIILPSGSCQFVLYFNVSGSILFACLFC